MCHSVSRQMTGGDAVLACVESICELLYVNDCSVYVPVWVPKPRRPIQRKSMCQAGFHNLVLESGVAANGSL